MTNQAASRALAQVMDLFRSRDFAPATSSADAQGIARSYGSDFSALWNFSDENPASRTVLIWDSATILDGVGNANLEVHLGPLAWATCALIARQDLEVVILDPRPERHRRESQLYRFVEAIQPERMPWLRLVTLENFGQFLVECSTRDKKSYSLPENVRQREEMLQMLSQQMREALTQEGGENDRHAIQNIVGPMVLLGKDYFAGKGVAERALLQVFKVTGLMPKELVQGSLPANIITEDSWGKHPLRLLLVDDQAECGWADWVRTNLPSSKPDLVSLDVLTSPEELLDGLDSNLKPPERTGDRRFELQLPGGSTQPATTVVYPHERQTVLLLDLRLHSMRSAESEAAFFKRLLPLCERFNTDGKAGQFAWAGFSPHELQTVQSWCENPKRERETDGHFAGLSLLPRLLALLDMSLPIIIFSSTGQRGIIEKFKPYGNILTNFEKPRFFGRDARNVVTDTQAKFGQAIERALILLSARRKCELLCSIPAQPAVIIPAEQKGYLELYLDETEEIPGEITVGGCFAFFTAVASAKDKADSFDDELVRKGARYFDNRGIGPAPTSGILMEKKRDGLADVLAQCEKNADAPQALGLLRLTLPLRRAANQPRLLDPLEADNGFRKCLKIVIELFLSETMPALLGTEAQNVTVSIYSGTRVVELNKRSQQKKAQSDYGMGRHPEKQNLFYSLGRAELYPVVAEVVQERELDRNTSRIIAIKMAYAGTHSPEPEWFVCLKCRTTVRHTYKDEQSGKSLNSALVCDCSTQKTSPAFRPDYRAFHYLADDILNHFPTPQRPFGRYHDSFKASQVSGEFDDVLDEDLEMTLIGSQALDHGDLVTAIEQVRPATLTTDGSKPKARYLIAHRIALQLEAFRGEDFVRLADRLAENNRRPKANSNPTPHA